jgi:hypothetical protein
MFQAFIWPSSGKCEQAYNSSNSGGCQGTVCSQILPHTFHYGKYLMDTAENYSLQIIFTCQSNLLAVNHLSHTRQNYAGHWNHQYFDHKSWHQCHNTAGSENVHILGRRPFMCIMQYKGPRIYPLRYPTFFSPQSEKKFVSIIPRFYSNFLFPTTQDLNKSALFLERCTM